MKVLHICNDFFGGTFYQDIFTGLQLLNVNQTVIVFLRKDQIRLLTSEIFSERSISIEVFILNQFYSYMGRLFPSIRNKMLLGTLRSKLVLESFDLIHAHTSFSNGSLAYLIRKEFGVPYIVSLRNTDVNKVFRYLIHQKQLLRNILREANKIIFLSPSYKEAVVKFFLPIEQKKILAKFIVIPNPIDVFWLNNIGRTKHLSGKKIIKVLFVGEITSNKNLEFLLDVFSKKWRHDYTFDVNIVGRVKKDKAGLNYFEKFKRLLNNSKFCNFLGEITNKKVLKECYAESDIFFMPSKFETFGLVYIESMSQGTPIIYSQGQGVDGYFQRGEVGYAVIPGDLAMARLNVDLIIKNYSLLSANCIRRCKEFSQDKIVQQFNQTYLNQKRKC
jgi:L-malate glycosyltransferase